VIGIGGGSALDAAKAIAGLLKPGNSVMDHLEGVGPELPYAGPAIPFIAVPTTAGTGSEATKNAVLSVQGADGFKKSFRDEKLVAEVALVDPDLLATCPPTVIAANGMDAFTQLLESYVSSRAAPLTDSLAWGGMKAARDGLLALHASAGNAEARAQMAYAALVSGITLAQVGTRFGARTGRAVGGVFPDPARRGVRHAGGDGHAHQYRRPARARTGASGAGEIRAGGAAAEQAGATGS
jgi:alcohol dehydrogenase class IV